jgi:hypothetical protein
MIALRTRVFLLAVGIVPLASAQSTSATLFGLVRDSTGAVVPTARVTAINVLTSFSRSAASDQSGTYLIIACGQYAISVEKEGFHRYIQQGITLG